jgi:eukaryotic-like serine/threonine-protein kinase
VTLRNPDFAVQTRLVEVPADGEARVRFSFWSTVARLTLEVSPWAEVVVDGEVWDTVPPQSRPLVLAPGAHTLVLRHPALGTYETSVTVAGGETRTLRFNLHNLLRRD